MARNVAVLRYRSCYTPLWRNTFERAAYRIGPVSVRKCLPGAGAGKKGALARVLAGYFVSAVAKGPTTEVCVCVCKLCSSPLGKACRKILAHAILGGFQGVKRDPPAGKSRLQMI